MSAPIQIWFTSDISWVSVSQLAYETERHAWDTEIHLAVSSGGGTTRAALTLFNLLRAHQRLTTYAVGNVDSAALLLFLGGRRRYVVGDCRFLIHDPTTDLDGTQTEHQLRYRSDVLKRDRTATAISYAQAIPTMSAVEGERLMTESRNLTAEEVLELGLAHDRSPSFLDFSREVIRF